MAPIQAHQLHRGCGPRSAASIASSACDHDDRHIVGAAALQHHVEQCFAGLSRRVGEVAALSISASRDMRGQAVACRARTCRPAESGHARCPIAMSVLDADGARDHVAARPDTRLLRRDDAAVEQFLHLRVIVRQLRDRAVAHQVDAAVAEPDAGELPVEGEQRRDRRADRRAAARLRDLPESGRWRARAGPRSGPADPAPSWRCRACARCSTMLADAISPASWPPMPSATSQRPLRGSIRYRSSLSSRTQPVSLTAQVSKRRTVRSLSRTA